MEVSVKNNRIFINYQEIAFLNADIKDDQTIFIELLKVKRAYRNKKYAKKVLIYALNYFEQMGFKQIKLKVLPLDSTGLNCEQLKSFYKKFDFFETNSQENQNQMIKYL